MFKTTTVRACRHRGCTKAAQVKGLCWMHHKREQRRKTKEGRTK